MLRQLITLLILGSHVHGMHISSKDFGRGIRLIIDENRYFLPWKDAFRHITHYKYIPSDMGDYISGLHYVGNREPAIETFAPTKGRIIKVSDKLWIYTEDDINDFHHGYIIHNGQLFRQPKSFFPLTWNLKDIERYILSLKNYQVVKDNSTPEFLDYTIIGSQNGGTPLLFVISDMTGEMRLLTFYPFLQKPKILNFANILPLEGLQLKEQSLSRPPEEAVLVERKGANR